MFKTGYEDEDSPLRRELYRPPPPPEPPEPPETPARKRKPEPDEEEQPKPMGLRMRVERYPGASDFIRGMVKRGWKPEEAAGAAGNVHVESGFRSIPSNVPGEQSFGLLQWNGQRLQGLRNYATVHGLDINDLETQMDYANLERTGDSVAYGGTDERGNYRAAFKPGGSPADIAERFGRFVERPLDLGSTLAVRRRAAEQYYGG